MPKIANSVSILFLTFLLFLLCSCGDVGSATVLYSSQLQGYLLECG
jgi:hypothetical protein